jgi:protein-disulfide isomerase
MSRLTLAIAILAGLFAGGFGVLLLRPAPAILDEAQIRAIFTEMAISEEPAAQSVAVIDPETLNPMIESYLMSDPAILDRMSGKLNETKRVALRQAQKTLLDTHRAAIYDDPGNVVLGNPEGDVTLVELFDYNCGYCRQALPDMATLLAEDPNLRIILKEFPILSEGSVDAARVAVLVNSDGNINYWDFHQQLFSSRGQVTGDTALGVAEELGMNRVNLMLNMGGAGAAETITKVYDLARALNVSGTPTYIIGDEVIPGAVSIDRLRNSIANMRNCGSTVCATMVDEPAG